MDDGTSLLEPEAKIYNYSSIAKAYDRRQTKVNLNKRVITQPEGKKSNHALHDFAVVTLSSLTNYTDLAIHPSTQAAYINVISKILFREEKILRLEDMIRLCKQAYFQYVLVVNQSLHSDEDSFSPPELAQNKEKLVRYQEQLALLIRSYREDTFNVIEAIQQWRDHYRSSHIIPSIVYKHQNYLLKMMSDIHSMVNTQLIRIWSGVELDCFALPPFAYNPFELWRSIYQSKFREWVEYRTLANSMKFQQENELQKPTLLKRTSMKSLVHSIASTRRKSVTSVAMDALIEQRNATVKEYTWSELMEVCGGAWDVNDKSRHSFWLNYSLKADVVEAAIGLETVFPKSLFGNQSYFINFLINCNRSAEEEFL